MAPNALVELSRLMLYGISEKENLLLRHLGYTQITELTVFRAKPYDRTSL
jgi:hypothetical protein